MKLRVDFAELREQADRMGAGDTDWTLDAKGLDARTKLLSDLASVQGVDIELSEIEIKPGKLLSYREEQVILYIRDTWDTRETLELRPEASKKFHICDCRALNEMRSKGRFRRYVATRRTDGLFRVNYRDEDGTRGEVDAALKPCMYCLSEINWKGCADGNASARYAARDDFTIHEFLMEFSTFFRSLPGQPDGEYVPNEYVQNWATISLETRARANWTCEQCGVRLEGAQHLLHCHHRNGVVTDNSRTNLAVLCEICHAAQPYHGHMKVPEENEREIERARTRSS